MAEDATYKFTVTADDGVRLYVDGQKVLDKWIPQSRTTYHRQPPADRGITPDRARVLRGGRGRGREAELRTNRRAASATATAT